MARPPRLLAAIALAALVGAGCSNAPAETGSSGGVTPAATGISGSNATGETGDSGDRTGPTGPPPSPAELQELLKQRRESAKCMRENGVEDFPDPDANGYTLYYGDDPDMASASEKCDAPRPGDRARVPGNGG
ncbi:hypothetical protein [Pseudonocardia adelaidensis]|uniref:Lipoprotein n=1 Tax=Pseudonocardia adelaidensis TaxID=648754 RepID=A0ABP9NKT7_9PSEU